MQPSVVLAVVELGILLTAAHLLALDGAVASWGGRTEGIGGGGGMEVKRNTRQTWGRRTTQETTGNDWFKRGRHTLGDERGEEGREEEEREEEGNEGEGNEGEQWSRA